MRLTKTVTLLLALAVLASCVSPDACAGWRPIRMGAASVEYLAAHDPDALRAVIGHAEFAKLQGCWK